MVLAYVAVASGTKSSGSFILTRLLVTRMCQSGGDAGSVQPAEQRTNMNKAILEEGVWD